MSRDYNRVPVVLTEGGHPTNFHRLPNGDLGERVTAEDATHFIIHSVRVEERAA